MAASDLTRAKFAGGDFASIEDEIRSRLQVKFASSFNDFTVSSLGIVLLDIVSYGIDTLTFYLDRRATDMYLATARTRRSIALLTRQLGYKMRGAVSASVDLSVAPTLAYAYDLPIPKGFQFYGPGNVIFEAAQAVTIPTGSTSSVTIPCYQGQTVTESFVSDGSANQVFNLTRVPASAAIAEGTVVVLVNGNPFTEKDFITFEATDQFEVGYNDSPPTLRFGDGAAGNIPSSGATISVTYVATLGSSGRVISGAITKPVTPLTVMFQPVPLVITNPKNSISGDDLEDLAHAQVYAPRVFKSRRIAVTRSDYEALAGSYVDTLFGRVAVAQAISARSASQDTELMGQTSLIRAEETDLVNTVLSALSAPTTGAFDTTTLLLGHITDLQAQLASLVTQTSALDTSTSAQLENMRSIKNDASEAQTDSSDAHTSVVTTKSSITSLRSTILGYTVAGATTVTSSDQTALIAALDGFTDGLNRIDALLTTMTGLLTEIKTTADAENTLAQGSQSVIEAIIGTDLVTGSTLLKVMNDDLVSSVALIGTNTVPYSGLYAQLQTILSKVNTNSDVITTATFAIEDHVDRILAADCKANLVSVPILARDTSGFYAAPSNGLIRSLQAFLDGVKEVTHSVSVTSGAPFLVPAAIRIRLGIKLGVSEQVLSATARSIVDGVLRDRSFGVSLYESDLVNPLKLMPGVSFVNVSIQGYRPVGSSSILADKTDADGNLIINESEVITLSQSDLTLTTEVVITQVSN